MKSKDVECSWQNRLHGKRLHQYGHQIRSLLVFWFKFQGPNLSKSLSDIFIIFNVPQNGANSSQGLLPSQHHELRWCPRGKLFLSKMALCHAAHGNGTPHGSRQICPRDSTFKRWRMIASAAFVWIWFFLQENMLPVKNNDPISKDLGETGQRRLWEILSLYLSNMYCMKSDWYHMFDIIIYNEHKSFLSFWAQSAAGGEARHDCRTSIFYHVSCA